MKNQGTALGDCFDLKEPYRSESYTGGSNKKSTYIKNSSGRFRSVVCYCVGQRKSYLSVIGITNTYIVFIFPECANTEQF